METIVYWGRFYFIFKSKYFKLAFSFPRSITLQELNFNVRMNVIFRKALCILLKQAGDKKARSNKRKSKR